MKNKTAIFISLFVVSIVSSLSPHTAYGWDGSAQPSDLTGYWALHCRDGRTGYFQLKQNGSQLEGIDIGFIHLPLKGTVGPNSFHLEGSFTHAGVVRHMTYDGTRVKGKIQMEEHRPLTVNGGGDFKIVGVFQRTTRDEIYPVIIPPPALRDLPDNQLVRTPPMGWNSWNNFHTGIDDETVRQMADALVSTGMNKLGYRYVLIDGGWSGGRDSKGNIVPNFKFPDMKALTDYVHAKGLLIGIYSSPGTHSCGGYPASYGHEVQDAKTFAAWGFDYLKYDWCTAKRLYKAKDTRGVYQRMGEALQASGRPIVYSFSEGGREEVWTWGAKAGGNLWRTTGDITDTWQSMQDIGFQQIPLARYATPGHWNDPDNLEVGNGGMTGNEYRLQMSLWAMVRAPLIAGNDLRNMSAETKSILMNPDVIAIDQDESSAPLQTISDDGSSIVLLRQLSAGRYALGFFNRGEKAATVSLSRDQLHLKTGQYKMKDVWGGQSLQLLQDRQLTVPAHSVQLYILLPAAN